MQQYDNDPVLNAACELLYRLGITTNYTGFHETAYAVSLCVRNPERLMLVTKWLYPDVAKQYRTTWKAVERNVRTVVEMAWQNDAALLEEIAGKALQRKPRAAQFLSMLSACLQRGPAA